MLNTNSQDKVTESKGFKIEPKIFVKDGLEHDSQLLNKIAHKEIKRPKTGNIRQRNI